MSILKIIDHPDLVKDTESGAIIANNPVGYNAYIRQQEIADAEEQKIIDIESSVRQLTEDMHEIKNMIFALIELKN